MAAARRCSRRAFRRACTVNGPVVCGAGCVCAAGAACAELLAWALNSGACRPRLTETRNAGKRTKRRNEYIRIEIPPGLTRNPPTHRKFSGIPFRIKTSWTRCVRNRTVTPPCPRWENFEGTAVRRLKISFGIPVFLLRRECVARLCYLISPRSVFNSSRANPDGDPLAASQSWLSSA